MRSAFCQVKQVACAMRTTLREDRARSTCYVLPSTIKSPRAAAMRATASGISILIRNPHVRAHASEARPWKIQHPIEDTRDKFEAKTAGWFSENVRKVIDEAQPYQSDDPSGHPLRILRELVNIDKHRDLVVSTYAMDAFEVALGDLYAVASPTLVYKREMVPGAVVARAHLRLVKKVHGDHLMQFPCNLVYGETIDIPGIEGPAGRRGAIECVTAMIGPYLDALEAGACGAGCYVCGSGGTACRGWYNSARTSGRGPTDRSIWLAGRTRTRFGHQNQRPITVMIDGVMSDRTTKVSNNRPMPIVVPNWPIARRSLVIIVPMVTANTTPAAVTTGPVTPMPRMSPVFRPAPISSSIRDTSIRL